MRRRRYREAGGKGNIVNRNRICKGILARGTAQDATLAVFWLSLVSYPHPMLFANMCDSPEHLAVNHLL